MNDNKGTMQELIVTSRFLGEDIEVMVYLPRNYSPLSKHQLLIAQDGQDYFNLGKISTIVDDLLQSGDINPIIIIGLPYNNVQERWSKYHPQGELHKQYIRFLGEELVAVLDETFPTFQIGAGRILIGESLGASVSLLTALSYPNTFGKVILQSPFVNEEILTEVQNFSQPHLIEIYQMVGLNETNVKITDGTSENFVYTNRLLHEAFEQRHYIYDYKEDEGDHTWKYWQPSLKRILYKMLTF
ncbi:alpha/beta hydrolase [Litchfieldia salsa]|uniref:Enterochelin esterase n=1 Tax=Litchfieldia salsa TaxID=930152 RepID=A0A1H0S248_9BACI|nr:alpha/beta hydrolase-fold protein [Litchfieldia salsa]SDP35774.1 Enterochelin esterase [Litchfieldia salsa]